MLLGEYQELIPKDPPCSVATDSVFGHPLRAITDTDRFDVPADANKGYRYSKIHRKRRSTQPQLSIAGSILRIRRVHVASKTTSPPYARHSKKGQLETRLSAPSTANGEKKTDESRKKNPFKNIPILTLLYQIYTERVAEVVLGAGGGGGCWGCVQGVFICGGGWRRPSEDSLA